MIEKKLWIYIVMLLIIINVSYAFTISGNLYYNNEDNPLKFTKVELYRTTDVLPLDITTTDDSGYYEFTEISKSGEYRLKIYPRYADTSNPDNYAFRVKEGHLSNYLSIISLDIISDFFTDNFGGLEI